LPSHGSYQAWNEVEATANLSKKGLDISSPLLVKWIAEQADAILNLELLSCSLIQSVLGAEHRHACTF
jgi:hypothetical protein